MTKEVRCKCKLCGAKHRRSFVLEINYAYVCNDCACEYRKIFFNYKNRDTRKREINPLFEAFQQGWLQEEQRLGLEHREIPQFMKDDYAALWEIEKKRWDNAEIDQQLTEESFKQSAARRKAFYEDLIKKSKENGEISENP